VPVQVPNVLFIIHANAVPVRDWFKSSISSVHFGILGIVWRPCSCPSSSSQHIEWW
jgi:hypothetical protein